MTELPSDLKHGYVVGRFILPTARKNDVEDTVDPTPARGEIFFSPAGLTTFPGTTPGTAVIRHTPMAMLDSEGYLSSDGSRGIWLATGLYTVTYKLDLGPIPPHKILVTEDRDEDNPIDLIREMPLVRTPAIKFIINEQVYLDTLKARDEAQSIVSEIKDITLNPDVIDGKIEQAMEEHTNSPAPHVVYDEIPDLSLIFDNNKL